MIKRLILTVGLPRSGKSTWASSTNYPVVNPDAIRLALHGKAYIKEAEDFVWATAFVMVRALFLACHHTIVVDATNITKKRRDAWRDKFPDATVTCMEFKRSADDCIVQARVDGREELIQVIERMAEQYEQPDKDSD